MGDTVREGAGSGSAKAVVQSDATKERTSFGGPFQPRKKSTYTTRTEERTQESEGCGYGGGMDHEVQSRTGGGTGCSRGRLAEGAAEVGTEEPGGAGDTNGNRGAVGKDDKN